MAQINFTSTYRIPITQTGVTKGRKTKLREIIGEYPNALITNNNSGNVRISLFNFQDAKFEQQLKSIGYRTYQKFDGENIPKEEVDSYIKEKLANRDYVQTGKNKPKMTPEQKRRAKYNRQFEHRIEKQEIHEVIDDDEIIETVGNFID